MRIGTDLDEIVIEWVRSYLKFFNKRYRKSVRFEDIKSYDLWKPLGISREEAFSLADEFYETPEFKNLQLVEGAKEGLMTLAEKNELFFITSRPRYIERQTSNFLKRNFDGILNENFDVFYSGDVFGNGKTKAEICEELRIEIFFEDRRESAVDVARKGIKVLLLDKPWNQYGKCNDNVKRVDDWNKILEEIKEREN